jgi:hypothetical protein
MSTAPARYERMRCLFDFAQTAFGFRLTVNGAWASVPHTKASGHSEFGNLGGAEGKV